MSDATATPGPEREEPTVGFDLEDYQRRNAEAFAAIEPHIPVDVDWCTVEHNHRTDDVLIGDDGAPEFVRFHRAGIVLLDHRGVDPAPDAPTMTITVNVEQFERVSADGTVERWPVAMTLAGADGVDINGEAGTALAAALLTGRDRLAELNA